MPGFLIQQGATVMCVHGGQAMALVPNPTVTLDGLPTCLLPDPWIVAGCAGIPPVVPPCVTATWIIGTVRVTSFGLPLLVQSSQAICVPTGTPLFPIVTQTRVIAT
jgi:hypothetical protein